MTIPSTQEYRFSSDDCCMCKKPANVGAVLSECRRLRRLSCQSHRKTSQYFLDLGDVKQNVKENSAEIISDDNFHFSDRGLPIAQSTTDNDDQATEKSFDNVNHEDKEARPPLVQIWVDDGGLVTSFRCPIIPQLKKYITLLRDNITQMECIVYGVGDLGSLKLSTPAQDAVWFKEKHVGDYGVRFIFQNAPRGQHNSFSGKVLPWSAETMIDSIEKLNVGVGADSIKEIHNTTDQDVKIWRVSRTAQVTKFLNKYEPVEDNFDTTDQLKITLYKCFMGAARPVGRNVIITAFKNFTVVKNVF